MCTHNGLWLHWNTQTRQARGRAFCIWAAPMTWMHKQWLASSMRPHKVISGVNPSSGYHNWGQTVIAHNGRMGFECWGSNNGGKGRGDNKALHLFTAGQMAGAQQVLKQSLMWVSENIAKQHVTVDGGGFQTNNKRPLSFWWKGGFWLEWSDILQGPYSIFSLRNFVQRRAAEAKKYTRCTFWRVFICIYLSRPCTRRVCSVCFLKLQKVLLSAFLDYNSL